MKKRSAVFCLVLALLVSLWVPALAADGAMLEVVVPDVPIRAGGSYVVSVSISGNPGFYSGQFTLGFDASALSCDSYSVGDLLASAMTVVNPNAPEGAILACAAMDGVDGDGTLVSFTFTALRDLSHFDFTLTGIEFGDEDGRPVPVSWQQSPPQTGEETESEPAPVETAPPAESGEQGASSADGGESEAAAPSEGQPAPTDGPVDEQKQDTTEAPSISFTDIAGHWGEESILRAAALGLFQGNDDGTFRPNDNITRAQFVTVLYRMAGSPETEEDTPFTDISGQIPEFQTAIAWAYASGYVNGREETEFAPTGTLTRQEAMTVLFRYSGAAVGTEMMFYSIYDQQFEDSGSIADWARSAMYWGVYHELINGTTDTTLSPQGLATRAQLAKILVYYLENVMA